eukprot:728164-Pelagomonas_calceolata.AAC.3
MFALATLDLVPPTMQTLVLAPSAHPRARDASHGEHKAGPACSTASLHTPCHNAPGFVQAGAAWTHLEHPLEDQALPVPCLREAHLLELSALLASAALALAAAAVPAFVAGAAGAGPPAAAAAAAAAAAPLHAVQGPALAWPPALLPVPGPQ